MLWWNKYKTDNIVKKNKWDIYGFEGNPAFDQNLLDMKSDIETRNKNVNIYLFNSTIAWTYDGRIDFYLDLVNQKYHFWGECFILCH